MSSLVIFTEQSPVILRQLRPEHATAYFETVDVNRGHLSQFGEGTAEWCPDLESTKDFISNPTDPRSKFFGIWAANILVGCINVRPAIVDARSAANRAEIGYWLDERHTGHGYATTALRAISSYVVDHIGEPYARVAEGNDKSMAVLERAGFTHTHDSANRHVFELLNGVA